MSNTEQFLADTGRAAKLQRQRELTVDYRAPRSLCTCGHSGDGDLSAHTAGFVGSPGHGTCYISNCGCKQFTWSSFTEDFQSALDSA